MEKEAPAHPDRESRLAADAPDTGPGQTLGAEDLGAFLGRTPRLAVAFSGGCDSACLLAAAREAGCHVRAYRVDTPFQPAFERDDAARAAAALGVPLVTIPLDMLDRADVCANGPDRCYRCKGVIFDAIRAQVEADAAAGLWDGAPAFGDPMPDDVRQAAPGPAADAQAPSGIPLADGTNASDDPARRPGFRALAERGVVSPLRRAGLAKAQVRALGARLARDGAAGEDPAALLADKPSFPCLAAFVPAGEPITADALARAARTRGL